MATAADRQVGLWQGQNVGMHRGSPEGSAPQFVLVGSMLVAAVEGEERPPTAATKHWLSRQTNLQRATGRISLGNSLEHRHKLTQASATGWVLPYHTGCPETVARGQMKAAYVMR